MRTGARPLMVALAFLVGMFDVAMPHVRNGNMPGDAGDTRFNLYVLEHDYRALSGADRSFVNADFFYPWPATIGFSDTHWGTLPAYALPRLVGLDQNRAFAVWFLTAFVLNFWAMWLVSRALGVGITGSTVAAYLFTFGIPVLAQIEHSQLLYRFWIPVVMYCLDTGLARRDGRWLAAGFLAWACELAASIYLGAFLLLMMGAFVVARAIGRRRDRSRQVDAVPLPRSITARHSRLPAVALVMIGLVILVLALAPYVQVERLYGFTRKWSEIATMVPRWTSYFYDRDISAWWIGGAHVFHGLPMQHEHVMFIGIGALLALATLLVRRLGPRDPLTRQVAGTLALMVAVTLTIGHATLYRPIALLPGFDAIRAVTRIILVMLFPIGLLVGVAIERLIRAKSRRQLYLGAGVALALVILYDSVLSQRNTSRKEDWAARDAAMEQLVGPTPVPGSILVVAVGDSVTGDAPVRRQIDVMRYAQRHGLRTLNGYSGNVPPGWSIPRSCDDLRHTVAAANRFIQDHALAVAPLAIDRMVLVGFGNCGG